jgi:hypothetical protein
MTKKKPVTKSTKSPHRPRLPTWHRCRVITLADFTEEDITAIEHATPPPEASLYDHELK